MPLYDFEDTDTGETFELQMKIAEKADFLKANPNVRQVIGTTRIVKTDKNKRNGRHMRTLEKLAK